MEPLAHLVEHGDDLLDVLAKVEAPLHEREHAAHHVEVERHLALEPRPLHLDGHLGAVR